MGVSGQNVNYAIEALRRYPPRAAGRLPAVCDSIYSAIIAMREARRAKWEPELLAYLDRDLARALEQWRLVREEVEEEERERPIDN